MKVFHVVRIVAPIVFSAVTALAAILFEANRSLQAAINKRDSLIVKSAEIDSTLHAQDEQNKSVVEKYISDCNILVGGRRYSTDELVQYMNDQASQIDQLNDRVDLLEDSLEIYKAFHRLAKSNLHTDFRMGRNAQGRFMSIDLPDSIFLYKRLYELAQRDYGIRYDVFEKDTMTYFNRVITRADSALVLFKYYGNKIKRDSTGAWLIDVPKK